MRRVGGELVKFSISHAVDPGILFGLVHATERHFHARMRQGSRFPKTKKGLPSCTSYEGHGVLVAVPQGNAARTAAKSLRSHWTTPPILTTREGLNQSSDLKAQRLAPRPDLDPAHLHLTPPGLPHLEPAHPDLVRIARTSRVAPESVVIPDGY